jgi:hypothetical protein
MRSDYAKLRADLLADIDERLEKHGLAVTP